MKSMIIHGEDRAINFLQKAKNIARLSAETRQKITDGKMKLVPGRLVIRKDMTNASGTQDLVLSGETKDQGLRNFDNAKLPSDNPFIIAAIKIAGIETAIASPAAAVDYTSVRKDLPAGLVNGKLEIFQDGGKILELEVVEATTNAVTASVVGSDDVKQLEEMALLVDNKEFEFKLTTPKGVAIAPVDNAKKLHVEVLALGWEIRKDTAV